MVDSSQIREHAMVVGLDGEHVGRVDSVSAGEIKLRKNDVEAEGLHHYIPLDYVQSVEGDEVRLRKPAHEVRLTWSTSGTL